MHTKPVRLLQVNPRLGAGLTHAQFAEAMRVAVVPGVNLPAGEWEVDELAAVFDARDLFGVIVADGLIAHDVTLAGRGATQLLGRGDVLPLAAPVHERLPVSRVLGVADASRLAVLDKQFKLVAQRWPSISNALLVQAERQLLRSAVQQLISQLPRAEQRVVALLWHLADRWGREQPEGVVVPIAVGHEAIARLAGGRRPTITAALGRLAERGQVIRLANGTWLLAHESLALLDDAPAPDPPPRARLLGPRSRVTAPAARIAQRGPISTRS